MIKRGRMTAQRRRRIAWSLRGLALLAVLAYLPGRFAHRSGGLVVLEDWLDHPVLLVGTAIGLTVVSLVVELEFRTVWSQVGCAAGLVALLIVGAPIVFLAMVFGGDGLSVTRVADPDHPDRVLLVTNVSGSIDPDYQVQVLTGRGWSARHWDLGVWRDRDPRGNFGRASWSGTDRITVTTDEETAVFTLDPTTGHPSAPVVTPR
ncbi:hypothetical protein [Kitasatospora albolonga]|uniref:hypothetical protein n=1 Tax=Kitasatospora albolonga TaxID=68173 RepID=UPI0031F159AE